MSSIYNNQFHVELVILRLDLYVEKGVIYNEFYLDPGSMPGFSYFVSLATR